MPRPLSDTRVLDLTRVLAGPWAAQNLADLGAEVIKIERPDTGDDTRTWGPPWWQDGEGKETHESAYFLSVNRGKKSVTLDLSRPEGQHIARALAERSDVLIENYKVGTLARCGLGYADIRAIHPGIIYCSVTGYGQDGPFASRPGYDFVFQGMGGLMSITGERDDRPGGGPQKVGIAVTDVLAGMYASLAITAALAYRQTGGAGQYARVAGFMEPFADADFEFENKVTGGSIPTQFIPACEKGFRQCLGKGPKLEFPVTGVKVVINDGASHAVDSSDMAFQAAARGAFREGYMKARTVLQEPIMKVVVETPTEFQGAVMGLLNQRRGMIVGAQDEGAMTVVESQVPLAEMFGFSTVLRSATQGKAQFTMEFDHYRTVPQGIAEKIAEEVAARKRTAA